MLEQVIKFLCFRRMNRRFVEDDNFASKIDVKFGIAAEKTFRNFACLPYQIALIFMQLLIFPRVIADDDQLYPVEGLYFVKTMIVHEGRFLRIGRGFIFRRRSLLQQMQRSPPYRFFYG